MSPVSRSRKSKKSKKSKKAKKRPGRAPGASLMIEAEPGLDWLRSGGPQSPFNRLFLPPDEPDWWQPAHELPPAAGALAFHASLTARRHRSVDSRDLQPAHSALLSVILRGNRQPDPEPRVTR